MIQKVSVAVVGASGYTGEELLRLLSRHPLVKVSAVTSRQSAGTSLSSVRGVGKSLHALQFENLTPESLAGRAEIVFLALPHGVASEYAFPLLESGATVIDLSADFRLKSTDTYREFYGPDHPAVSLLEHSVYALPEWHRDAFKGCRLLACPGCYPTSVILPLAPFLQKAKIASDGIVVNSMSGISGAGKKADLTYSFCEREANATAYGWPKHRHLSEMEQELSLHSGRDMKLTFTPHLLPWGRGMLSTISAPLAVDLSTEEAEEILQTVYAGEPFIRIAHGDQSPEIRDVVYTNTCFIAARVDQRTRRLQLVSVIDNLVKGASGQAVQVMNLVCGFEETAGLKAE